MNKKFAFQASGYYCKNFDEVEYMHNQLICVNENGMIEKVFNEDDIEYKKTLFKYRDNNQLHVLKDDEIMLPGFVDLHIHAPQWAQSGTALDKPLEVWLDEYTFPLEARFKDLDFAKEVYEDVVDITLKNGTTTGVYFATVDREASVLLAKICGEKGQRGFVGKVAMDDPAGCPDYYKDFDGKSSITETENFIKDVLKLKDNYEQKVYPVITPRFIPSCTNESLEGLGKLAKKYDVHIQTHASESDWAHGFVKEKLGKNDVKALWEFGLMGEKSMVAHAPFLEDADLEIMIASKTTIAHCPLSNAYFANAVLPVKEFHSRGINIGLATDISGGYSPSIYHGIRQAVISSKMLQDGVNPRLDKKIRGRKNAAITLNNAFYLATVAGGKALGIPVGKLEKGYAFDVQIINTKENIPRFYKEKHPEDLLHKVLLLAQTGNIKDVWVQGRNTHE